MRAQAMWVIGFGRELVRETLADDVGTLAASLAYRFLFALFPFFIFLGALSGIVADVFAIDDPAQGIMNRLGDALPSDASSVLEGQLHQVMDSNNPGLLSIGFIVAIWAAAGGMNATIKALNRVYDVEEMRPLWRRYLLSIGLTVFGGVFVIAAFVLLVAGDRIVKEVIEAIGAGPALEVTLGIVRFAGAIVLMLVATAFLYWVAPNANMRFHWVSPGAVLFVVVWTAATLLFGLYVSNFGSYNTTYGALGGVIILLLWFYLTAYIMLVGAELNAILGRSLDAAEAATASSPAERRSSDLPRRPANHA